VTFFESDHIITDHFMVLLLLDDNHSNVWKWKEQESSSSWPFSRREEPGIFLEEIREQLLPGEIWTRYLTYTR